MNFITERREYGKSINNIATELNIFFLLKIESFRAHIFDIEN